ncbi:MULTISPECIES: sulfate ABC transporter permease subunit CysT [unclassified Meiothermus]|uniref:sulfate ABC transporter permease subunit CysT n=1 Tax=unclassified Meiothermus TaxID=370471 RepID=UPI000D7C1C80|nr:MULTISPECIES: sulfate ABC transporter permease subunit CysT [unclassified Meiothermus]PZA07683.1 sulfate ABC transporter permease subunit CysT [Meiothermus sp. Pnk-1]RYM36520.1 sulfate ABC transporter permease subunit CysT [Meiothermus sp. PNK-Is4]
MASVYHPPYRPLPGFGLSLGYSLLYLSLIVLIPLGALVLKASSLSPGELWALVSSPRVVAALTLSFGAAAIASLINLPLGLLLAWVLTRCEFPGRRVVDALIDLPFALPTAVAGITLTSLLAQNGWVGSLLQPLGLKVAYTRLGVVIALVFIGIPFVVRTVQPVLEELSQELEEAALTLGASRWQTFRRVIFPLLLPALLTGFSLALARTVGEYGSIVFISGNLPFQTEIAPLLIVARLEQYDYAGAAAIGVSMLVASLSLLLVINGLQARLSRPLEDR